VDKIGATPTVAGDKPANDVVIEKVAIERS
jgi:peptidyl-prolyl cis-trans isomerase A (cyclophilin A)